MVYHERRLPGIRVKILTGVHLFSLEAGLATAWAAFGSDRLLESANAVIATSPGGVVDDEDAD